MSIDKINSELEEDEIIDDHEHCEHEVSQLVDCGWCCGTGEGANPDITCNMCGGTGLSGAHECVNCGEVV